jgi:hypothetical protein
MKIYVLLMLIGMIVTFSHLPIRRQAKASASVPPNSITAQG